MKATASNIQSTGRMCLAAHDQQTERSWKLIGTAAYETEGPNYDMAQAELQKNKPGKRFKGVVAFTIDAVYDQAPGPNAGSLVVRL
jgi:predicted pyridoxine 5'-phosphate oxidase superfamily flavin-nucleotide-binding protein